MLSAPTKGLVWLVWHCAILGHDASGAAWGDDAVPSAALRGRRERRSFWDNKASSPGKGAHPGHGLQRAGIHQLADGAADGVAPDGIDLAQLVFRREAPGSFELARLDHLQNGLQHDLVEWFCGRSYGTYLFQPIPTGLRKL